MATSLAVLNQVASEQSPPVSQGTSSADVLRQVAAGGDQQGIDQSGQSQGDAGFLSGLYNSTIAPAVGMYKTAVTDTQNHMTEAGQHLKNGEYLKAAGSLLMGLAGGGAVGLLDKDTPASQMFHGIIEAHKEQLKATAAAYKAGHYTEAAGHGLATALPVLGPMAATAGEDIGAGKTGQGLGEAAGTIGAVLAPDVLGKAGDVLGKGAKATTEAGGKIASGTKALFTDIPAGVESKLVSTVGDAAEDAGLSRPSATTLKEAIPQMADQLKTRAQSVYQELDQEAPGFQELRDKTAQLQKSYKAQLNLDPAKADEIGGQLKTAQQNMNELLDAGQQARWKAADADWSRYKALQKVGTKTAGAAEDLTDPSLTSVNKLHAAAKGLTNATRAGNPIDLLSKAFGDHAEDIRSIIQEGTGITSNSLAAKTFWKWAGGGAVGVTGAGVAGYALSKALGRPDGN